MIPTVDQAVALHQAGRLAEAEQCYRTILGVEPKTIGAFRGLGTVLLQTDRAAEAAEPLQTALDIEPDNADTLNNLGSAQLQLGQLDNARKTYEQAVALRATSVLWSKRYKKRQKALWFIHSYPA